MVTLENVLAERIRLEKDQALAPEDEAGWDRLLVANINDVVDGEAGRLYTEIERDWERSLGDRAGPRPADLLAQARSEVEALRAQHVREAEIIVGERLHAERVPVSGGGLAVNISATQIAALNLGTVVGGIQASVRNLHAAGQGELAAAVKALTEAVAKDETLKDAEKSEAVELVSAIGEELEQPAEARRPGLLRTLGTRLSSLLSSAATASGAYELVRTLAKGLGVELP